MTTPNQCQFWDCDEIIRGDHFLCREHYRIRDTLNPCPPCGQYKDAKYELCLNCARQPAVAPPAGPTDAALLEELRAAAADAIARTRPHGPTDAALLEELRGLRRNLARTHRLQDFMVFSNDTLEQLATMRPTTAAAMLTVNGVGPVKLERYGADVLRVIRASVSAPPGRESRRPAAAAATTVERDNREFAADKDADRFFVYILMQNDGEFYIGQTRELHERLREHLNNQSAETRGKEPKFQWFTTVQTRKEAADLEAELKQMKKDPGGRREIHRWIVDFEHLVKRLDFNPHPAPVEEPTPERRMPHGGVSPPSSRSGRR